MTLHFPLMVNGTEIGTLAAHRVEGIPDSDGTCGYYVDIRRHQTEDKPSSRHTFYIKHQPCDGAWALVQKAIAESLYGEKP